MEEKTKRGGEREQKSAFIATIHLQALSFQANAFVYRESPGYVGSINLCICQQDVTGFSSQTESPSVWAPVAVPATVNAD